MNSRPFNRTASLAVMVGVMLFAAFMHLYLLNSYPPGLDSDAAHDGLDALKLIRYHLWPFYSIVNSNPDPVHIYTAALTTTLFGARALSLRFASVLYGLLGVAATYTCLRELGRGSFEPRTRYLLAVFSAAALAVSQSFTFFNRMALRFVTELPFQMLAIWALARALRTSSRPMWLAAGALAGLTQYTYHSARALPFLFLLILVLKLLQERPNFRTFAVGAALYAGAAFVVLLPQIIWYAYYPQTLLARAGQTSFMQNPLYAEQGLSGVLLTKLTHYVEALSSSWDGQYNQIKEPLLAPFFFYAFVLGLGACVWHLRKWFTPLALGGLGIMLLPDLVAGDRTWPHELRLIGVYPFVAALAGLGLASLWDILRRRVKLQKILLALLALLGIYTAGLQAYEFFSMEKNFGRMYWGGNTWLRRVDNSVGELIADDTRSYLLPLGNYADIPVKYLTANRVVTVQSALDADGNLLPALTDRQRPARLLLPRGDADELWAGDLTQWVLFAEDKAYILPPLDAAGMEPLLPPQTDETAIYGRGSNTPVRVGHWREAMLGQLPFAAPYRPAVAHSVCFEVGMCLTGATYNNPNLSPGSQLRVWLYWQIARPVKDDYVMFVHLLDRDGNAIAKVDAYPLGYSYHTHEWRLNETILSQTTLDVPADLQPGPYALEVGFYLPYLAIRVNTVNPNTGEITGDHARLPDLKIPRPTVQLPAEAALTRITFGDELELVGYRLDALPSASQPLRLTLWWRGLKPASQNWTGFFHLTPAVDGATLVGQSDHTLTGGAYPPTIWEAGELVEEQIEISANSLAAGRYALWVGLYSPATFERVAITESPGEVQDNRTVLAEFEVK